MVNLLQMGKLPDSYRRVVGDVLATMEQPLMTRTVHEYLWGYRDPLLAEIKRRLPEFVWDDQIALFGDVVSVVPLV